MIVGPTDPQDAQSTAPVSAGLADTCAIILSGGLRPSPLMERTGCATLNLWLTSEHRVIDLWLDRLASILEGDAHISVVPSRSCPTPDVRGTRAALDVEPDAFRGPAGVVRDVAASRDDRTLFVAEAARYLDGSLCALARHHRDREAITTIGMNPNGSPAGVYLIEREMIDLVPARGFFDLKEQWLPKIRECGRIEVVALDRHGSMPLHTPREFLDAAGVIAMDDRSHDTPGSIWWTSEEHGWSVIAGDAHVEHGALVEDSVIQPGALVRSGAVVARSIICAAAQVHAGMRVVDDVLGGKPLAEAKNGADE